MKIKSKDITINKYPISNYTKTHKAKKLYHSYNPSINDPIENKENKMTFMQNLCRHIHNLMGFFIFFVPLVIVTIGLVCVPFEIFFIIKFGTIWALISLSAGLFVWGIFRWIIFSIWEYKRHNNPAYTGIFL